MDKIKCYYSDGMDLLNALESLQSVLVKYGVKLEILDGGDSYEEIRLSKLENKDG